MLKVSRAKTALLYSVSLASILILGAAALRANPAKAVSLTDCENNPAVDVSQCVDLFSKKIADLGTQTKTLSSQIAQYDTQIKLTKLKISEAESTINQLEKEISALGFRIGYVTGSIDQLEKQVRQRIVATYQQSYVSNLELVITSNSFSDLILRLQYLRQVQENDKKILSSLQQTKSNYENQKDERQQKQAAIEQNKKKLEGLQQSLDSQRSEKEAFLQITKNDEARYQRLLAQAQAEQAIVFGGGHEVFMRDIKGGDTIGSIASHSVSPGCSTGAHLHFEVHKNGALDDPNNYLRNTSYSYAYSGDQISYYGSINPHGDLPWPLDAPITIDQGYGSHPFARAFYANGIHAGIDMDSPSGTVHAVKDGKLYGGSYNCSNGALYYAKVDHSDGLTTWYLHMVPR